MKHAKTDVQEKLEAELQRIKAKAGIGSPELRVLWVPEKPRVKDGRELLEEVRGNTILIYERDPQKAVELVRHGFAEWLLDRHTRPYRLFLNKLIELFEQMQYSRREEVVEAIARLL